MKRVELTAVSAPQKQKKVKWKQSTNRFVLILGESNSETCPEYSFADLVKNVKPLNGSIYDEADDDRDVAAIAQRFEAKYGPKSLYSGKRKRTQEMDDFYDPGEGYDEDDPFIDNTEAHDEVVPSSLMTQHGGFYINQGKLDFKCLNEDSSDEFTSMQVVKKKKKQRVLNSESDEETGAALAKKFKAMKKKRQLESKDGGKEKRRKRLNVSDREQPIIKKKKFKNLDKLGIPKSVPDVSSQKEAAAPSALKSSATSTPSVTSSPGAVTSMNKAGTASLANGAVDDVCSTPNSGAVELLEDISTAILPDVMKDDSSSKSGDEGKGDNPQSERNTSLPSQLPSEIKEAIENLKREAKETKEKKLKFFSDGVNQLLLDIELRSRSLPWGSKTAIFSHLGEHLPCGKYTLQRRAKKLRESQDGGQLKMSMQKLKEAILKVMPGLEEQHELDVQKAKMEFGLKEDNADPREEASTESEGEDKDENKKKPRGPRRKFQWNSEIRDLLLHIVSTKMKLFSMCKPRTQTAEEFLKAFLESDLKPMWPQGWVQTRMLFKESRNAHGDLIKGVLQQGKQRKASIGVEATPSNAENIRTHTSRTEDVIEISSNFESDDENNTPVVVNQSNMDTMPPVTSGSASLLSSSTDQTSKPSFKTASVSAPVSNQSAAATTALSHKAADNSTSSAIKRITPVPLLESTQTSTLKSAVTPNPFNPGFTSNAASPSGTPGSNAQQTQSSNHQPNSHQQKVTLQQKSTPVQQISNSQQQKLPQELHKTALMQQIKAAKRSPVVVVNKDIPNSSWTKINSFDPANKSINPVVAVNRIPENHVQRLSLGSRSGQNIPAQNSDKILNNAALKGQQTLKKPQQGPGTSLPSSAGNNSDFTHLVSKTAVLPQSGAMSSKQDCQNRASAPNESQSKVSNPPNAQSKFASNVQRPSQPLGTGAQPTSDLVGRTHQSGSGDIRQPSSPGKPVPSSAPSPPPSSISTGLLNINTTSSLSRSSTPSPQKSPASPEGNAALSLYDQIRSQIFHQEAMEDQALKNLAMALKFGGSTTSTFYGK